MKKANKNVTFLLVMVLVLVFVFNIPLILNEISYKSEREYYSKLQLFLKDVKSQDTNSFKLSNGCVDSKLVDSADIGFSFNDEVKVRVFRSSYYYLYCVETEDCLCAKYQHTTDIAEAICCDGPVFIDNLNFCRN